MDTTTVAHPALPTTTNLNARAERALRLFEERGSEIRRAGEDLYLVPSCSGRGFYTVDYREEACDCPDFEIRGEVCKHVLSVGIPRAKRRGATVRRLTALEERYRHELLGDEERQGLRDRVLLARRRAR